MATLRGRSSRKGTHILPLTAITAVQRARFLQILTETGNEAYARKRTDIKVDEVRRLESEDREFAAQLAVAREAQSEKTRLKKVKEKVFDAALRGDVGAAKFLLSTLERETFGPAPTVTINLTPEQLKTMTLDELRAIREQNGKR